MKAIGFEGICRVCKGAGNFATMNDGRVEWWQCPCCRGHGTRSLFGPAMIGPGIRSALTRATGG